MWITRLAPYNNKKVTNGSYPVGVCGAGGDAGAVLAVAEGVVGADVAVARQRPVAASQAGHVAASTVACARPPPAGARTCYMY